MRLLALDPATEAAFECAGTPSGRNGPPFGVDYRDPQRVFTWEDGRDVHPDVIRQRFNRLSARCGLPRIRLYDMRHSYATAALKAGVHLKIISARLGHASETFTAGVYQHALPGVDRDAANSVAAMLVDDDAVSNSVSTDHEDAPEGYTFGGVCAGSGGRI